MLTFKLSFFKRLAALLSASVILFAEACKKDGTTDNTTKSNNKVISSFNFLKGDGSAFDSGDIAVTFNGDSINVTIPITADVTKLMSDIKISAAGSVSPKSGTVQTFTNPVVHTVTAEDGSTHKYIVSVRAIYKNMVYVGGQDNNFYALDYRKGTLAWKYTAGGNFSYSTPAVSKGMIYSTNTDNNLYALDQLTGTLKWKFASKSTTISSPAVADGIVYFGSDDHSFYAVDAITGSLKWQLQTGGNVDSSPVIANGVVYIGSADGYLYALDKTTGALKWRYNTGNLIVEASPVVSNEVVYIGNRSGNLYAITTADGKLKWSVSFNSISLEQSRPVIQNGVIYIASWYNTGNFSQAGSIYALNEATGTVIWTALAGKGFTSGPTIANGKVFINADDTYTYALNSATGTILWQVVTVANGSIIAANSTSVFPGGGGSRYFYSLDAVTGLVNWKFALPNSTNTSKPYVIDSTGNTY